MPKLKRFRIWICRGLVCLDLVSYSCLFSTRTHSGLEISAFGYQINRRQAKVGSDFKIPPIIISGVLNSLSTILSLVSGILVPPPTPHTREHLVASNWSLEHQQLL